MAQTGPLCEADTGKRNLYISLFIRFDILKIINSLDRKVVVPLLYAGELPENFQFIIMATHKQVKNSVLSKVDSSGRHCVRVNVRQFLSTVRPERSVASETSHASRAIDL